MEIKEKNARGLALQILEEVFSEQAYSNIALNKYLTASDLSVQDKHLVTELVYGTVARKMTLEWQLAHLIEDRNKLDSWVYHLLMLSLYQLLYLDKIPEHAVVNEAVVIAKKQSKKSIDKFVNAILRQFLRQGPADVSEIKRVNKRYSIQYSLPVWLVKEFIDEFGVERAEKIFASLFVRNKASIRVVDVERKDVIKSILEAEDSQISPVGLVKEQGHFAAHDLFQEGAITIQDETSQLVAPSMQIQEADRVLDACSAPGGKTSHIASYLTSGQVVALDLYDHKLALVRDNAQRLGLADKVETRKLDARQVHEVFPEDTFDKILVDAPCSGMGLIRRKPDIKYNKENADFTSLQKIQLEILDSVCQTLRKNGTIAYSTCTIFSKENHEVVTKFLETHPNFEQVMLRHEKQELVKDGCILVTPEQYGTDGFFISQLKKIS